MQYVASRWPSHDELSRLVHAVHAGGPRSLDEFLTVLRPSLVTFFERRCSTAVAEDLAQAALIRIARAAARIDPDRADRYVVTVARNIVRSEYRRRTRDAYRYMSLDLAADVEAPGSLDAQLEHEELAGAVRRVSREMLPPPLGDIVLELLRGLTPTEIADHRRENPVTIRTRMMRARALLRHELRAYLDPSDQRARPGD